MDDFVPQKIKEILEDLANMEIYVAGGPIRDTLLGRTYKDIDLTVPEKAREIASYVAKKLGNAFIPLDEAEGVYRVAMNGFFLDFSSFRKGSKTIEEDLLWRDFTINAMAVTVSEFLYTPPGEWALIDPAKGREDLAHKILRTLGRDNFADDPLRMLRGYRLAAELGFGLEPNTRAFVRELHQALAGVSPERISTELLALFAQEAGEIVSLMAEDKILFTIFPELEAARGVLQPSFHHLDVLGHLLLALKGADAVIKRPERYFGPLVREEKVFESILSDPKKQAAVRMAALFHDIGKPHTFAVRHRITFYEHDRVGEELFWQIGRRLRFAKKFIKEVAALIKHHMRPFHLLREFRAGRLSKRAMRRLLKDVPDWRALFMVAMADSLASAGPDKEEGLEAELAALFWEIYAFEQETFAQQEKKRLVSGKDLIEIFGLEPGPLFKELLEAVEEARAEGQIKNRDEAISFLAHLIRKKFK